jgi:hypothetical protein
MTAILLTIFFQTQHLSAAAGLDCQNSNGNGNICFSLQVPKSSQDRKSLKEDIGAQADDESVFAFRSVHKRYYNNLGVFNCNSRSLQYSGYFGIDRDFMNESRTKPKIPEGLGVPVGFGPYVLIFEGGNGACDYIESIFKGKLSPQFDDGVFWESMDFQKKSKDFKEIMKDCNDIRIQAKIVNGYPSKIEKLQCFKSIDVTEKTKNGRIVQETIYQEPGWILDLNTLKNWRQGPGNSSKQNKPTPGLKDQ